MMFGTTEHTPSLGTPPPPQKDQKKRKRKKLGKLHTVSTLLWVILFDSLHLFSQVGVTPSYSILGKDPGPVDPRAVRSLGSGQWSPGGFGLLNHTGRPMLTSSFSLAVLRSHS
ncbi:unnamed protein product [Boreogadus saida]